MSKDENEFLIDDSFSLNAGQKITAVGITVMFWAVFLYLLQPIISLVAWWLNVKLFYNHMIVLGGYQVLLEVIQFYVSVIVLLGGGLIVWGRINQWRFKGNNSREFSREVNNKKINEFFLIDEEKLSYLQASSRVKVSLNKSGAIVNITD